jgi:hypothetical protein
MVFGQGWRSTWIGVATMALVVACSSGSPQGSILRADAQFSPASAASAFLPVSEANPAVAQTFTVLQDGKLDQFWLVITDGESADAGTVRITIQPVSGGGVIDDDPNNSLIDPIMVNTTTLPALLVDEFTEFDLSTRPGRDVLMGERYALVVEFVSRATSNDTDPIARVLGQLATPADNYTDGTGATGELGVGFTNNTDDYFFRTFVLTEV